MRTGISSVCFNLFTVDMANIYSKEVLVVVLCANEIQEVPLVRQPQTPKCRPIINKNSASPLVHDT